MSIFQMPSLGADMEAGTLTEWLVKPGDQVSRGDVVAVVETHKGAIEIEIFEAGIVEKLEVAEGESVPVGTALAIIRVPGETEAAEEEAKVAAVSETGPESEPSPEPEPAMKREPAPEPAPPPAEKPEPEAANAHTLSSPADVTLASPAARSRAAEAAVDLAGITGSGPDGAVLLSDVEHWLEYRDKAPQAPAKETSPAGTGKQAIKPGLDMAQMRLAIAAAMSRSKREIPHYYLSHTIDLQTASDWLAETNSRRSPEDRLLMGALFVRATVLAAQAVPSINGRYENSAFQQARTVNAGIAVSMRGGGLIAPAILNADSKTLDETMAAMRELVARTRTGRLRNSEVTQGTITISSMGDGGVDSLWGVIYPPQVALVGFGTPRQQFWPGDTGPEPRISVTVTLAADHRVSDGRPGAKFLTSIDHHLQEPESL